MCASNHRFISINLAIDNIISDPKQISGEVPPTTDDWIIHYLPMTGDGISDVTKIYITVKPQNGNNPAHVRGMTIDVCHQSGISFIK